MSRINVGDCISELNLPAIDGRLFSIEQVAGRRYLLSFFRFAGCPFCNMRVHELVKHYADFGPNFTVVGIFDSSLENLQRHAEDHHAPFALLADADNVYYRRFGVERSVWGVIKGLVLRLPRVLHAVFIKGFIPRAIQGNITTMPLNILVDENGRVQYAHYGRDEGDHIPLMAVREFALSGKVPPNTI
jgi:thioredoxin-dependent peroxiredoxin